MLSILLADLSLCEEEKEEKEEEETKKRKGWRKGKISGSETLADTRIKLELYVCSYVMNFTYFHSHFLLIGSNMVIV